MHLPPATQEMAEIELGLERARQVPPFRRLLLFFWGLIVAKCLLLQWVLWQPATVALLSTHGRKYDPVEFSLIVFWIPSFLISSIITVYFARRFFTELPRMPLSGRLVSATWVGCTVAFALLALAAAGFAEFSVFLLPAVAAVLLGLGNYIQSVMGHPRLYKTLAVGWWLASVWLFLHPGEDALPWASLFIFSFQALPSGWLYLQDRRAAAEINRMQGRAARA